MQALDPVPPLFREALAAHAIVEAFGISTANIFVSYQPFHGGLAVVARQGKLQADIVIGTFNPPLSMVEFTRQWKEAVSLWNDAPQSERRGLVDATHARGEAVPIFGALMRAGFEREEEHP